MTYQEIRSGWLERDALLSIEEYLKEVAERHPEEEEEQLKKGAWFAIGYLEA